MTNPTRATTALLRVFTVIGLYIDNEPVVAGVIEGAQQVLGADHEDAWADLIEAASVEEAEQVALARRNDI